MVDTACVFIGTHFDSDIHFALNNDPKARDSIQCRIIMTEMSREMSPINRDLA